MAEILLSVLKCDGLHEVYSYNGPFIARALDGWTTAFENNDLCPQCTVSFFLIGIMEILNGGKKLYIWNIVPEGYTFSILAAEFNGQILIPLGRAWARR